MGANSKSILIAEDEKPMAKALELKLSREGFLVSVVHNGEDALSELKKGDFALLLCDLVMPKMDGFELLAQMREDKIKTPVVILSNLSQEEDKKKSIELGAKDFFIKSNKPITEIVEYVKKAVA